MPRADHHAVRRCRSAQSRVSLTAFAAIAALVATLSSAVAGAQTTVGSLDSATAASRRLLLDQAQAARAAGRHADALDRARRAVEIATSSSVLRFIAEEQITLGLLADALGTADSCLVQGGREPPSDNRETVISGCRAMVADLRTRVGQLVVSAEGMGSVTVRIDGRPIPDVLLGAPHVVTPGRRRIEATAAGFEPWSRDVEVAAGQTERVTITLTPSPRAAATTPAVGATSTSGATPTVGATPASTPVPPVVTQPEVTRVEPDESATGRSIEPQPTAGPLPRHPAGFILGAGGLALMATAGFLRIGTEIDYQGLREQCTSVMGCSPVTGAQRQRTIQTIDGVGYALLATGAVATAVGTALIFALRGTPARAAPTSQPAQPATDTAISSISLAPSVSPHAAFVELHAAF